MAELRLKNSDIVYTIPREQALKIRDIFENTDLPNTYRMTIDNLSFEKGAIRFIDTNSVPQIANNQDGRSKVDEWELEWKKRGEVFPRSESKLAAGEISPLVVRLHRRI